MIKKILAEFCGTLALVLVAVSAIISGHLNSIGIALANGVIVTAMITAFSRTSGAHFNPAVSFAMMISRRLRVPDFFAYTIAQLAGGTAGALLAKFLFAHSVSARTGLGKPSLGSGINLGLGLLVEILATFLLLAVIFIMAIDERTPSGIVTNVAIGLIVAIDIVWAGSISGGAMNPARWFGPALVSGNWSNSWIWIVGPLAGSAIATLAYEKMVKPKK